MKIPDLALLHFYPKVSLLKLPLATTQAPATDEESHFGFRNQSWYDKTVQNSSYQNWMANFDDNQIIAMLDKMRESPPTISLIKFPPKKLLWQNSIVPTCLLQTNL